MHHLISHSASFFASFFCSTLLSMAMRALSLINPNLNGAYPRHPFVPSENREDRGQRLRNFGQELMTPRRGCRQLME